MSAASPDTPPHAPQAGGIRRWLGPFYVTGVFWFRIHKFGASAMPRFLIRPAIVVFTSFFFLALRNIRKAVAGNLEAVLGPCGWWERQRRIFRTLWTFAWCLTERYERLATRRPFSVTMEGEEMWRELLASGQGFLLVTAHLGPWEGGSMAPAQEEHRRVHVVREGETDPAAQKFVADLIRKAGGEFYTTHFAEDPQLGVKLLDALRAGEIVALQGDRPRSGGKTISVTLFGRPYALPLGPLALARAADAPLVPAFLFRDGRRRYSCLIREPIRVGRSGERYADLEAAARRFTAELEAAIRREPYQWFCFRQLWL